ncbi:MAG: hypothetical protein LBV68_03970 [Spirochaetaceae bacterium]|nr:hypothetical protein [Spirochaetaceae bacterium]
MDEQQTLNHLLDIEKNAAKIVDEAKNQALDRINEIERRCRSEYEAAYKKEYNALEDDYNTQIAELNREYEKKIEDYTNHIESIPINQQAFVLCAEQFLFQESAGD